MVHQQQVYSIAPIKSLQESIRNAERVTNRRITRTGKTVKIEGLADEGADGVGHVDDNSGDSD